MFSTLRKGFIHFLPVYTAYDLGKCSRCDMVSSRLAPRALHPDVSFVLFDECAIAEKVAYLGAKIAQDMRDDKPLLMVTLNGAFMFSGDLARSIQPEPPGIQIDFVKASSYGQSTVSSGAVNVTDCSKVDCSGRNVLIVEDIVDTGLTLTKLAKAVKASGAKSVKTVTLLDKVSRRKVDVTIDYIGFMCPDEFVVGYGMDYQEKYRNLPYVGILKPEIFT